MKHSYIIILGFGIACLSISFLLGGNHKKRKAMIGQMAPDFTLEDENGTSHTLSSMRGTRAAISWFPIVGTSNCNQQICSIGENQPNLEKEGITVWAISPDSKKSLKKFKDKKAKKGQPLTNPLLSDPKRKVAKLYAVKGLFWVDRVAFLINEKGIIVAVIEKVDVKHHAQQIIDAFKKVANK